MKKILFSISIIAAAAAVITGGTLAYFSDTETSTGNTFTAGTLNLQVGDYDPMTQKMTFSNMKPTDPGNGATWLTKNTGSLAGNLSVSVSAITNSEGTNVEAEGDQTDPGDLGGKLKLAFWMDVDKSDSWTSGDYYLRSDAIKVANADEGSLPAAAYDVVNNYASDTWANAQNIAATTDAGKFRVEYNFPDSLDNTDSDAMGDSSTFNITFDLKQ